MLKYLTTLFNIIFFMGIVNLSTANAENKQQEVNIYSAQKEHLIRPILDVFTKNTGIKANLITGGKAELVTRLEQEGELSPADVLLTVDIGNIYEAQRKNLLQPIKSETIEAQIPASLRSEDGYWFGLTIRTRAIFYAKDRVKLEELSSYAALTDAKWKGKIAVRSSSNVYNQSLLASMIAHDGEESALSWAKNIVANFARNPRGGDRDQIRAVAAGVADIAIANSYYYGRMIASEDESDRIAASKVGIFFPDQNGNGSHVNIRGGGVTANAKNKDNAVKLMEFLTSDEAQIFFAEQNFEYPAKETIELPKIVKDWGTFKRDEINLEEVGKHNRKALMVFDDAGWS